MLRLWKSFVAAGLLCVSAASSALELGGQLPALNVPQVGANLKLTATVFALCLGQLSRLQRARQC